MKRLESKSSSKDEIFFLPVAQVIHICIKKNAQFPTAYHLILSISFPLGFMGKVLIEKLLRSAPDLNRIYVLIRAKKNKSPEERLEDLKKIPVFNRLREECPDSFKKLYAVDGDVTELGLGFSAESLKMMENVSVIFHSAASVRFDDPLKSAILMNTRGTVEVMKFAETLKGIRAVLHVSTTYCNPDKKVVEEFIYPANGDWRVAIKMAERFDEDTLNALTQKYTNREPNTYTFTKGLAEQVVKDYSERLPVIIYRPSIVVSALDEPMPGESSYILLVGHPLNSSNSYFSNFIIFDIQDGSTISMGPLVCLWHAVLVYYVHRTVIQTSYPILHPLIHRSKQ